MSAKGGPVFTFGLPGGVGGSPPCPHQLRHCLHIPVTRQPKPTCLVEDRN